MQDKIRSALKFLITRPENYKESILFLIAWSIPLSIITYFHSTLDIFISAPFFTLFDKIGIFILLMIFGLAAGGGFGIMNEIGEIISSFSLPYYLITTFLSVLLIASFFYLFFLIIYRKASYEKIFSVVVSSYPLTVIFSIINLLFITPGPPSLEIIITYLISSGFCILGSAYLIYKGLKKHYERKMCIISIVLISLVSGIWIIPLVFFIMVLSVGFAGPGGL